MMSGKKVKAKKKTFCSNQNYNVNCPMLINEPHQSPPIMINVKNQKQKQIQWSFIIDIHIHIFSDIIIMKKKRLQNEKKKIQNKKQKNSFHWE